MKKRTKTLIGLSAILVVLVIGVIGAAAFSGAWFGDTVTANDNTFDAGTLELDVNGTNTAVDSFHFLNLAPGAQPIHNWTLKNVGSIQGYLDIEDISISQDGGALTGPEKKAGETVSKGDLGDLLNVRLFWDKDGNGWIGDGEPVFYNGKFSGLPTSFSLDYPIPADSSMCITMIADWHQGPNDNLGQGDSLKFNLTFELGQTPGQ